MHHETKYNLIYLTILSSTIWLLRKVCLNVFDIYEYIIIALILYPLFMIPLIYYKRGNLSINLKKFNYKIILYLIIIIFLSANSSIYFYTIVQNEDISIAPSLMFGLKIISVFVLGVLFLKEKITIRKIISLITILVGIFLFALETNK